MNPTNTRVQRLKSGSLSRRESGKTELKRQILEAALVLFQTHGYEGFSLRQVAEAIGYSPTTIYLYFKDKDELLLTVALEGFKEFGAALQAAYLEPNSAVERIKAIGLAYLHFGLSHPLQYRLMFMQRSEFLVEPLEGYVSFQDSFGVIVRAIEDGIKSGKLRPLEPRALAALLWSAVHGVVSLALSTEHFPAAQAENLFRWHMNILEREYAID